MGRLNSEVVQKITVLRQKGASLPEISQQLNIPKTTVYRYIKNVQIFPEFKVMWAAKRGGSMKRRLQFEAEAYQYAKELITELSNKEKLLFLTALYWAEGNKKDLILTNTDHNLIKVFMNFARDVLKVKKERFQISIRLYEDISKEESLLFWSKVTKIPVEKFLAVHTIPGKKKGKIKYGMCRVRITKGGDLLKRILAINKVVSELLTDEINMVP